MTDKAVQRAANAATELARKLAAAEARIEALEKVKGLTIPKNEWSLCVPHSRVYWTEEGCPWCRIEALENAITIMIVAVANTGVLDNERQMLESALAAKPPE